MKFLALNLFNLVLQELLLVWTLFAPILRMTQSKCARKLLLF